MHEKSPVPNTHYLENFLDMHLNSRAFLHAAIEAFHKAKLPYALIGSLARKCWFDHRDATKDADLLITDEYTSNLRTALSLLHYDQKNSSISGLITLKRNDCAVEIDIMVATAGFDPEESCVHDTVELPVQGFFIPLQLGKPEYLAWMLANSPHSRHRADLQKLMTNPLCDVKKLLAFMRYAKDVDALEIIKKSLVRK